MRLSYLFSLACLMYAASAGAQARLTNSQEIYGLLQATGSINPSLQGRDMSKLRVAIIDYGFVGFEHYGKELGANVEYISTAGRGDVGSGDVSGKHGFAMAQIFMAASGAMLLPESQRPKLLLIESSGYSQFKKAVEICLGDKNHPRVDLIIHSRNFVWGSDFNGGGLFNAEVARATEAGIVWINSAGNNGDTVYFSNEIKPTQTLMFENRFDDQTFTVNLTWNDFRSDSDYATNKDLDFAVFRVERNQQLIEVPGAIASKQQLGRPAKANESDVSINAFEEIQLRLPDRGMYAIEIYDRSQNFDRNDRFQLKIKASNPDALNFISKNRVNEITAPADRSDVIAVGVNTKFSSVGFSQGRRKPDVVVDLRRNDFKFQYSDSSSMGLDTSSATAIFGGITAALMNADQSFNVAKLQGYLNANSGRAWVAPNLGGMGGARMPQQPPQDPRLRLRSFNPDRP